MRGCYMDANKGDGLLVRGGASPQVTSCIMSGNRGYGASLEVTFARPAVLVHTGSVGRLRQAWPLVHRAHCNGGCQSKQAADALTHGPLSQHQVTPRAKDVCEFDDVAAAESISSVLNEKLMLVRGQDNAYSRASDMPMSYCPRLAVKSTRDLLLKSL